jgi:hypothetical protein
MIKTHWTGFASNRGGSLPAFKNQHANRSCKKRKRQHPGGGMLPLVQTIAWQQPSWKFGEDLNPERLHRAHRHARFGWLLQA